MKFGIQSCYLKNTEKADFEWPWRPANVADRRSSSYLSAGSTIASYEISGYRDEEISFFCIYKRTIRKMLQFDQPMAKKFEWNFRRFEWSQIYHKLEGW